ncbi:hypothetical protein [Ectobacillus panaciterrae]|uniref:hypothetical protein n=1 Tax=Ectobacillus panaciterrae TaxID=363872 RepID=UPI00049074DC|nr:hypothetical protein [Ectobacillus panaciterrae]
MEIITVIGTSIITGLISIMALYFSFSKKVEGFYEETNDSPDTTGIFLIVGWILMGLHKLYKLIFPKHHSLALRITTFTFGIAFLVMAIGIWFIDLTHKI